MEIRLAHSLCRTRMFALLCKIFFFVCASKATETIAKNDVKWKQNHAFQHVESCFFFFFFVWSIFFLYSCSVNLLELITFDCSFWYLREKKPAFMLMDYSTHSKRKFSGAFKSIWCSMMQMDLQLRHQCLKWSIKMISNSNEPVFGPT